MAYPSAIRLWPLKLDTSPLACKLGGKQVHDANIVATMQAYGIPALLTHNIKDFEQFGEVVRIEAI